MKIGFLTKCAEYAHSTPVMDDVFKRLRQKGVQVQKIVPEEQLIDLSAVRPTLDLYVLRPGIELGLSLAGILHDQGANLLNTFPASTLVQDKVRVTQRLLENQIPTARSFVAGDLKQAFDALCNSLIVKPHRGSYGEGIRIFHDREGLPEAGERGGHFVQEYHSNSGEDLKVYVIGNQVFALRRKFPAHSYEDKLGTPVEVDDYLRRIALRIGQLFGLHVYGIDCIDTDCGLLVIDVNFFPGFVGVPNAAKYLSAYILEYAEQHDALAEVS